MAHVFYLAPSGSQVGLTSVALGLVHALEARGSRVAFFKPIGQWVSAAEGPERSSHFVARTTSLLPPAPIPFAEAEALLSSNRGEELLERVVSAFNASTAGADVVIVEGLVDSRDSPLEAELNLRLIDTLGAEVILVATLRNGRVDEFKARLKVSVNYYANQGHDRVLGCIVNRVAASAEIATVAAQSVKQLGLLPCGVIPEKGELGALRTCDVATQLRAAVLHAGDMDSRRVHRYELVARTVPNVVAQLLPGSLLVTPSDRSDVVVAVALAVVNKVAIAGLLITGDDELPPQVLELCAPALATGMPLLRLAGTTTWEAATALLRLSPELPADDLERARTTMHHVAAHLDIDALLKHSATPVEVRLSPAAFCWRLVEAAAKANKRIVLPEGTEPRTIKAAIQCTERKIARCVLLGDRAEIGKLALGLELALPPQLEIIDPREVRQKYVAPLAQMRKHKGVSEREAAEMLEDNVWLGTVMLALGEVDGLVSGAVHSTANTIRPAFQIIKSKPGTSIVSSVFFMCLPDQVVVYGDCAVNPDPDAKMLADIALQSADSALRFGIEPRVAMLSYSTGDSGAGADVDKVREATRLARERRPDLLIDGPMQYDAAANAEVAANKAPQSRVAGRASVFVFPDLNTGNTTYKAVQRSAHVVSIGPMLQGLRRPVNDLSRGALVEDIVYTIAITAIQATDTAM